MPDDNTSEKKHSYKIADLTRVPTSNFFSTYANNTHGSSSFYDLRLVFGQVIIPQVKEPYIEDRASITITWEHVGPLRDLLDRMLKTYQAEYGPARRIDSSKEEKSEETG